MPYSEKQQIVARIAEHAPQKLYARNRSMLKMNREELHKFATEKIMKARGKKK